MKIITKDKARNDINEEQPAKKRKISENSAVVTATKQSSSSSSVTSNDAQTNENTSKGGRTSNTPFRRIDPSKISHDVLVDNRYEFKVSVMDDNAAHANVA